MEYQLFLNYTQTPFSTLISAFLLLHSERKLLVYFFLEYIGVRQIVGSSATNEAVTDEKEEVCFFSLSSERKHCLCIFQLNTQARQIARFGRLVRLLLLDIKIDGSFSHLSKGKLGHLGM